LHDLNMDFSATLKKTDYWNLAGSAPDPFSPKIAFIHFDLSRQEAGLLAGEVGKTKPEQGVEALGSSLI
jgi:hypothetical protein